jgi:hypothetical protein
VSFVLVVLERFFGGNRRYTFKERIVIGGEEERCVILVVVVRGGEEERRRCESRGSVGGEFDDERLGRECKMKKRLETTELLLLLLRRETRILAIPWTLLLPFELVLTLTRHFFIELAVKW